MAKMSRNKGARFEREVAKVFSSKFDRELRRVPASGGIVLRCDIYDPKNDDFPFFIECKNRSAYRFGHLIHSGGASLVDDFFDTVTLCAESHLSSKYSNGPDALLVFKGGDFKEAMVMCLSCTITGYFTTHPEFSIRIRRTTKECKDIRVVSLSEFMFLCKPSRLTLYRG